MAPYYGHDSSYTGRARPYIAVPEDWYKEGGRPSTAYSSDTTTAELPLSPTTKPGLVSVVMV